MQEPTANDPEEGPRGKVDLPAVLYAVTGVPGIVLFLVVLFAMTRSCGIPA